MAGFYSAEEVISIGVEIETNGQRFYTLLSDKFDDPDIKKFFKELADWEKEHILTFSSILKQALTEAGGDTVLDQDADVQKYMKAAADSHVFVANVNVDELVSELKTPLDALKMAMNFEKDSIVLYWSMKSLVPVDLGQKYIDKLINEELTHVEMLNSKLKEL